MMISLPPPEISMTTAFQYKAGHILVVGMSVHIRPVGVLQACMQHKFGNVHPSIYNFGQNTGKTEDNQQNYLVLPFTESK